MSRLEALGERRGLRAKSTTESCVRRRVDGVDVDAMASRTTTAVVYALGGAVWRPLLLYLFDERAEVLRLRA